MSQTVEEANSIQRKAGSIYQKVSFQNAFTVGIIINAAVFDLIQ